MNTQSIYKGKLLNIEKRTQELPNGKTATLEVVKHPGAALIVPIMDDGRVILLKQFRPVLEQYIYELPAGTLEPGESPLECARREIMEETGYRAEDFTDKGLIYPVPGYSTERIHIFEARTLSPQKAQGDEDEIIETHCFEPARLKQLMAQQALTDAKTICALAICGLL